MLPAETPKLSKWPFLLGDALLLGTAWLIADQARNPFSGQPLIWIVVCVVAAAVLGAVPFLADYARKQDEALDERQRGLEAISRTVAASAEQISIAANGLHELTELAQRNLKAAGQLGPGLEEKVAALKAELTATRDDERAALRKEIAALKAADLARVEAAVQQLARTAADVARAESDLKKQLSAAQELCSTAGDLAVTLNGATEALQAARSAVLAAAPDATEAVAAPKRVRKSAPAAETGEIPAPVTTEPPAADPVTPVPPETAAPATEPVAAAPAITAPEPIPAPVAETPATPAAEPALESNPAAPVEATPPPRKRAPRKPRSEPATAPALEIPLAAAPAEPTPPPAAEIPEEPPAAPADEAAPADSDEPAKAIEQSRSSDGATRLLVTAYIGIGNRLFIRGEGPGLSWEKGVPLQFVSIGKWRWESSEPTSPVKYKLYKNDAVECTALGEQQIDPGQQQEVAAAF